MPSAPAFSRPVLGSSLALALLLHALGLGAATLVGFSIAPAEDDGPDTFRLSLAPPRPAAEASFAAALAEPASPVSGEGFSLAEPELIPSEIWESAPQVSWIAPVPLDEDPPVALDLTPADLLHLDLGVGSAKLPSFLARAEPTEANAVSGGIPGGTGSAHTSVGASLGAAGGAGPGRAGDAANGGTGSPAPRPQRIREATAKETPAPAYPVIAQRAGEHGSVLCRLHLSEAGVVTEVDVVESSGFPRLDEAARVALLRWRYEPRLLDERPVASTLLHRIKFQLEG